MVNLAKVYIWGEYAGAVLWNENTGTATFEYESSFPGCSSETEPGAKTVARLSQKVRQENIPVVFTVEFSNKKVAQSIVCDSEAKILTLHSCHNVTNDAFISKITYVELMTQNINNLREALD